MLPKRLSAEYAPGYTTTDDFGTDGDDTPHSTIPSFKQPNYIQANASFPEDVSSTDVVDVVFLDFFAASVVKVLNTLGSTYTIADVGYYVDKSFTTRKYLPEFAKEWQANVPSCPVCSGVGS
ncbi:5'-Nucleotidase [Hyaloscypha variabilis]